MAAIYSNGGNRWNILGFNFTKRDALSSVYKISMVKFPQRFLTHVSKLIIYLCKIPTVITETFSDSVNKPLVVVDSFFLIKNLVLQ
jgi:hypothetical protein